jgi:hypothetical protein
MEFPYMQALSKDLEKDVAVRALDWYEIGTVPQWLAESEIVAARRVLSYNPSPMRVLFDPDFKQIRLSDFGSEARAVVIDRKGVVRWAGPVDAIAEIKIALRRETTR